MDTSPAGAGRLMAWLNVAACMTGAVLLATLLPRTSASEVVRYAYDWVPSLGVRLSFVFDGLSVLFGMLITVIGAFIALYANAYLRGHPHLGRFFLYLLMFTASMLGLVLADNLITLFVFWELTTVASFLLIGFNHESETARRNAWQGLLVTGAGGLALLAGLVLLASVGGSWELSELRDAGDVVRADPLYPVILALVLAGAFTKSAQFPFHFWLPNAMAAPTPVSAYLHSATMVKAGIYLLARLHPTLGGTTEWIWTLSLVGAFTAVWASFVAVRQTDLKMALAYTTVMALGTLTMFLGSEAAVGIAAAVTFLVVHALYKCTLFLVVGNIDHGTGTREIDRLGGLARAMPATAVAAAVAALSMAGFPPFLGFIGKELKYEGALAIASEPFLVATAAVVANALMVVVAAKVAMRPFVGRLLETPASPHEAPVAMLAGPWVLAALGLILGLLPPMLDNGLVEPAVEAILGERVTVTLALWHGVNWPLVLSAVTLGAGALMVLYYTPLRAALARADAALPVTGDRAYDAVMAGLARVAEWQTRWLQGGLLRRYLLVVFAVTTFGVAATLMVRGGAVLPALPSALPLAEWGVVALVAAATLATATTRSRVIGIGGLGVVGGGVALVFLMYGPPDVAMTQLLVEVLFVVIIAIVLLRLPGLREQPERNAGARLRDAAFAVAFGLVMAALVLAVVEMPVSRDVTTFFEAASLPEAHGRNIVNVILVDFRALDTLGEVTVVAVAALAVLGLIRLRPERRRA